jgi:trafficking protein particle complex subunit 10
MSFEGMNLSEDALRCYDELESSFAHVLREKNLSWFGTLIIPDSRDDSLPLLSITKKPYRDLILANTVSVFDLRIYMLAKQCNLLGKIGKLANVCNKVAMFLTSFGRHLRDVTVSRHLTDPFVHTTCTLHQVILPSYFIESWIYSSALSAVEQVDIWATDINLEGVLLNQFNACKGELLDLVRNQVRLPRFSLCDCRHSSSWMSSGYKYVFCRLGRHSRCRCLAFPSFQTSRGDNHTPLATPSSWSV